MENGGFLPPPARGRPVTAPTYITDASTIYSRTSSDLPAPVRTPVQRRITIAALAVAAVIVAAGIFGGGTAVGFYANWSGTHRSVTTDQPMGTNGGSTGSTQQLPGGESAPSLPGGGGRR